MSTSATGKRHGVLLKSAVTYLSVSVFCVIFTLVYGLFGHGVRSFSMDAMFLYPLSGALLFFALGLACPRVSARPFFRAGRNLFNSGIAALTTGAALQGIVEIAGTGSRWIRLFGLAGAGLALAGIGITCCGKADGNPK